MSPAPLACELDARGLSEVLLEMDQTGGYLDAKACEACADGAYVFEEASTVAGVYYAANPFLCQTCPDDHMSFDSSGECQCTDG